MGSDGGGSEKSMDWKRTSGPEVAGFLDRWHWGWGGCGEKVGGVEDDAKGSGWLWVAGWLDRGVVL